MAHFGVISPPSPSHLTGFTSIGRELIRRGHRVSVFNIVDARAIAEKDGLEFHPLGIEKFPLGFYERYRASQATSKGLSGMRAAIRAATEEIDMWMAEGLDSMREARIDMLLVDKVEFVGSTIAEMLGIRFVTVCNACITDRRNASAPPAMAGWSYSDGWLARWRNRAAWRAIDFALRPLRKHINGHRRTRHLKEMSDLEETSSPWAEISQQTEDFDFPRLPDSRFHYVGLLERSREDLGSFPFEKLNGKPLLYATFGTMLRANVATFATLSRVSEELGMQLVIGLGGTADPSEYSYRGADTIAARYAPQRALLKRASVSVCHSGLNSVLESLAYGVPVLAVPTDPERQSVAARLVRCGAGERIALKEITFSDLNDVVRALLTETRYKQNASRIADSTERAGGQRRAACLIELVWQVPEKVSGCATGV